ncbi:hypothetical protein HanPI659440_Chr17g0695861 [Helianthus annuus]|nr:hypothetical protein HanPI659440_Chr17g0695861 [Helianthus annuus]
MKTNPTWCLDRASHNQRSKLYCDIYLEVTPIKKSSLHEDISSINSTGCLNNVILIHKVSCNITFHEWPNLKLTP